MDSSLESMLSELLQSRQPVRMQSLRSSVQNPYRKAAVLSKPRVFIGWLPSLDTFRTFGAQLTL
jgi:hypothetical protein